MDTVVGAAVLDLLAELRREPGLAMVFISHDLAIVRSIADDVMIMYAGRAAQTGSSTALTQGPIHPYAELLALSVPELRTGWLDDLPPVHATDATQTDTTQAAVRQLADSSCAFFRRCTVGIPGTCDTIPTPDLALSAGAIIRCVRTEAELLHLQGRVLKQPRLVAQPAF